MKLSRLPFHSILLAIYPIAYLYARNIVFIPLEYTYLSLLISITLTIVFLLGFAAILRSWEKAGLLCSLMIFLFFSFGHIANALEKMFASTQASLFSVPALGWAWLVIFLVFSFLILRSKLPAVITPFLNVTSLMLLIFPMVTIISTTMSVSAVGSQQVKDRLAKLRGQAAAEANLPSRSPDQMPDIYYIIFDSYERADVLSRYYGFDNSPFIAELEKRSFYVASSSRSNYLNTTFSLNTALNMIYFSDFPPELMKNARYNLQTNYVSEFLRARGYRVVVFDSGTGDSNNQYADIFLAPESSQAGQKTGGVNAFETLLLRTTVGLVLFEGDESSGGDARPGDALVASINHELDVRRDRVNNAFDHLPDYAAENGPHFVFAHIYLPHIPFLYGPGGEERKFEPNMNFYWYEPAPEDYIEQYIYQIEYLNQAVLRTIDRIIAASKKPVVIIVQSDHGDDKFLKWDAPDALGVSLRSTTFNAMYFSDGNYQSLYPTISTVNTFRVIFNHWFGASYPMLPDRVFFHKHPLETPPNVAPQFWDACEQFKVCSGAIQ
jgi:hypothetical protein